jgi:hypothetical protein
MGLAASAQSSANTRRLASSSMWRLNSTVMALSPLGKRRGGAEIVTMASLLIAHEASVFCVGLESAFYKSINNINKLIGTPTIRYDDRSSLMALDAQPVPRKMRPPTQPQLEPDFRCP